MYTVDISNYIYSTSRTRKGLRVLIANDIAAERAIFFNMVRHYLTDSIVHIADQSQFMTQLEQQEYYDLVVLSEAFTLEDPYAIYINAVRGKCSAVKIAIFMNRDNLYRLHTYKPLTQLHLILTTCSPMEAIAEKLCLMFQERD